MPYVKIETNLAVTPEQASAVLSGITSSVAAATGKPERAMQVAVQGNVPMMMAGSEEPNAYVAFRAINFAENMAGDVTKAVCAVLKDVLALDGTRIYVSFDSYPKTCWGIDSRTF